MKVAILTGPRSVELREAPLPEPGPGQVRVRLEGCGLCGSNLPVWQGRPWFTYPQEPGRPGHEGWGVVEAVGRGVKSPAVGQRVATLGQHSFAEYEVVDAADAVALPPSLKGRPAPGEPLACAVNVLRRAQVGSGQPVVIVGVGFLGALLIQLAAAAGAQVIAIARRPFAQEVARRCGAQTVLGWEGPERIIEQLSQHTPRGGFARVIEAVGEQSALDLAAALVGVRGRLIIAGYHQDGPRTINLQDWNWRGLDVINAHEREPAVYQSGLQAAVGLLAEGRLDLAPLITHTFPLCELGRGLDLLDQRPEGFLKAVVTI